MREGKIPQNWTDIVQLSSQIGEPDNINLKDNWFTPDLEEDPRETPNHKPSVAPENNNNMLTLPQSVPYVKESPNRKGASISEVIKHPASEGFRNT